MTNARWSILCINFPDEPIVLIHRKSSVLNREMLPVLSRSPKRDEAFEDLLDVGGFGSGEGLGEGFGGGGAGGVEGQLHGAVHPGAVGDGEEEGQSWGRERFLRAFRELGGCWGTFFAFPVWRGVNFLSRNGAAGRRGGVAGRRNGAAGRREMLPARRDGFPVRWKVAVERWDSAVERRKIAVLLRDGAAQRCGIHPVCGGGAGLGGKIHAMRREEDGPALQMMLDDAASEGLAEAVGGDEAKAPGLNALAMGLGNLGDKVGEQIILLKLWLRLLGMLRHVCLEVKDERFNDRSTVFQLAPRVIEVIASDHVELAPVGRDRFVIAIVVVVPGGENELGRCRGQQS